MTLPVAVVGAGPGRPHDRARPGALRHPLRSVRGRGSPLDRDQGGHDALALARDLAPLRRGIVGAPAQHAGRRDRRHRPRHRRDRAMPVRLSALARETRFPFVINLPQQDMEPALAEPVHERLHLSPSAHPLRADAGKGGAAFRDAARREDGGGGIPARLRRRPQHGARSARHPGRRKIAAGQVARWSIWRSTSMSRIRATIPTSPISPTRRSG